jgi:hypothetical protein
MTKASETKQPKRILLTGVFGPFGVDDEYGRKENIMELFHNQVTREQEIASFRFHHRSFGLYFIAENIDADVTVLDFPSKHRFEKEISTGYDVVGISFITPNYVKAREMARIARKAAPETTIILGGHGAAIEGVEELIDCDHVVKGEGIRWMRRFLGQDQNAPIVHPILSSTERASIFGVPLPGIRASLLVPGVGCVNGCKFCSTSHFFGRSYTPYLASGKALFDTACRIADQRGTDEFFVMDENFLKDKDRAMELLAEMERRQRYFEFNIFSSAEAIEAFGLDNLVRLGVKYLWIGVESSSTQGNYEKNKGIDPGELIRELRKRGILVLASGILCMEHHTQENIQQNIDFMVALEADFVQFMLFTPLPVTALYQDHRERGLLRKDLPFEEWHGQKMLAYKHPHFPGDTAAKWIKTAFRQDYQVNGSSMLRIVETSFRGYSWLARMDVRDKLLEHRMQIMEEQTRSFSSMLPTIAKHAVNRKERDRALALDREIKTVLPPTALEKIKRVAAKALVARWKLRVQLMGDTIQPKTIVTRYRTDRKKTLGIMAIGSIKKADSRLPRKVAAAAAMTGYSSN